jgi:queuine tRNA-ribosyltransferase
MPVGTVGTVKAMYIDQVKATGADIILGNTYHLMLRPGAERSRNSAACTSFIRWPHPILTDSGGFQVMSLAKIRKLDERRRPSSRISTAARTSCRRSAPSRSSGLLGSDIQMQLDECIALPAGGGHRKRWSCRCAGPNARKTPSAITAGQGRCSASCRAATNEALRLRVRRALIDAIGFEGYAVGGLAVGEPQKLMLATLDFTTPALPTDKPRYLMGVGTPDDILESVARGIDMFDCVMPTRSGRHGQAFTRFGKINIRNAKHATDMRPLDDQHDCPALSQYSRAYLHHLIRSGEMLGMMLMSWANIAYYESLMKDMRAAIAEGRFEDFRAQTKEQWRRGETES